MSLGSRSSVGLRLSLRLSAIALAVAALLVTTISLHSYRGELERIADDAVMIRENNAIGLVEGLWNFDDERVATQLAAVADYRHVGRVTLSADGGTRVVGDEARRPIVHRYPLVHPLGGHLGDLEVVFDQMSVVTAVRRQVAPILGFLLLPILAMATGTILLFHLMVGRHVTHLADFARGLTVDTLDEAPALEKRHRGGGDELDDLRAAFDQMTGNLRAEIATREAAERRLEESEVRQREIFNATSEAIFIHEAGTGRIIDVNRPMLEMYGYTRGDIPGLTVADLTDISDSHSVEEAFRRVQAAAAGEHQLFDWRARRKDGSVFWAEVSLKRMEPESLNVVLAVVRDVSARREAEDKLRQQQKMETLGRLAGGLAHDVNNVLGGILGTAEEISALTAPADIEHQVEVIRSTCERAAGLTGKLLAFSRSTPSRRDPLSVSQLLTDTREILVRSIDKRIDVELELAPREVIILGDVAQLQNALLNLGLNARDAMPEGGRLTLRTRVLEDRGTPPPVEIVVADTGLGMDEAARARAFEPFFTTKPIGEGTGLGLASVYGTVTEHGGTIEVDSAPGRGTVMRIVLPTTDSTPLPASPRQATGDGSSYLVLVIDDEELLRSTTSRMLTRLGHRVITAANGADGVEVFRDRAGAIDLVIVDMAMPRMNGAEVFHRVREIDPSARIVISTGFAHDGDLAELSEAGLAGLISKPFRRDALARAISEAMGGSDTLQGLDRPAPWETGGSGRGEGDGDR